MPQRLVPVAYPRQVCLNFSRTVRKQREQSLRRCILLSTSHRRKLRLARHRGQWLALGLGRWRSLRSRRGALLQLRRRRRRGLDPVILLRSRRRPYRREHRRFLQLAALQLPHPIKLQPNRLGYRWALRGRRASTSHQSGQARAGRKDRDTGA